MTRVAWTPGTPITLRSSLDEPLNLSGRWTLYFYVPPGTKVIGLFGGGAGQVLDPDGKSAFVLDQRKLGYYSVRRFAGPGRQVMENPASQRRRASADRTAVPGPQRG